ncbi:MAG: hypothetical protein SGPRY_008481 [Prymnesium sp.]
MRSTLLLGLATACSAFVATPMAAQRARAVQAAPLSPQMLVEPSSVDAASQLMAMQIPITAYTPAKQAFIMMFSNVVIICGMSIEGKGLARGTSHDEMVESFGITWLLAGTALVRRLTLVIPYVGHSMPPQPALHDGRPGTKYP